MDIFNKQLELGPEPMRRQFLEHLCQFYYETSKPLATNPTIGKNPFDLYKVYAIVKEKGGFQEVCKPYNLSLLGRLSFTKSVSSVHIHGVFYGDILKFLLNFPLLRLVCF